MSMVAHKNPAEICAQRLSAKHLEELRESGLSDEAVALSGMATITDPVEIGKILRWGRPARSLGPCLKIPFSNGFARLKPDKPRIGKDDKPIKYEQPAGAELRAYYTPGAIEAIKAPGFLVLITSTVLDLSFVYVQWR